MLLCTMIFLEKSLDGFNPRDKNKCCAKITIDFSNQQSPIIPTISVEYFSIFHQPVQCVNLLDSVVGNFVTFIQRNQKFWIGIFYGF